MHCPKCSSILETIGYEGVNIESCPRCEGQWLDAGELRHIVNAREVRFDEQERQAIAAATKITPIVVEREDRDLKCPKCSGRTDALNYGGDTGIVIDKCPGCGGVWLDASELNSIQMMVEGWEDGLPADLAKYGPRLRQISREVDEQSKVRISRFGFVNAIINGILDLGS